jgi:hypothetical protein
MRAENGLFPCPSTGGRSLHLVMVDKDAPERIRKGRNARYCPGPKLRSYSTNADARSLCLALTAAPTAVQIVDRLPPAVLLTPVGPPRVAARGALEIALLDGASAYPRARLCLVVLGLLDAQRRDRPQRSVLEVLRLHDEDERVKSRKSL